jgi:hypothetical protein
MFVVDGDVTYRSGETTMRVTSGQFVYLPRGLRHGFALDSAEAHLLILISPGGLDAVFDRFSRPAPALTLPPPAEGPPLADQVEDMLRAFEAAGVRFGD